MVKGDVSLISVEEIMRGWMAVHCAEPAIHAARSVPTPGCGNFFVSSLRGVSLIGARRRPFDTIL